MLEAIKEPWPWYVAGPLIGLAVPVLLLFGNKSFGISSSLRHICAACLPTKAPFFNYDWKKETWNLFFAGGIVIGAIVAAQFLSTGAPVAISDGTRAHLEAQGVTDYSALMPADVFSWEALFSLRGFVFTVVGGFLVGFGTRYAGGCTSGHSIMGLSNLQWPSLVATCC
ncbi:MAG TPA: YeeE/YedE thiosulfate transporter family protein, partial [Flavobacteriales bacterium]|nr:YeeE/YedE thiosulfate transporter family protein [Flavobacteriales bacterium]